MMDIFNAKALAAEQSRCLALERELGKAQGDLAIFKFLVRDMDMELYRLSQCTSQADAQPIIARLVEGMVHRKKSESDRINAIIQKELTQS